MYNTANPATELATQIIKAATSPKSTSAADGANWPPSAILAVEYNVRDKQFPQVEHSLSVRYFDDANAMSEFFAHKREWIKGTDYDFSMEYDVYEWDWGPVHVNSGYL